MFSPLAFALWLGVWVRACCPAIAAEPHPLGDSTEPQS